MNEQQRIRQQQACHIRFKQHQAEGVMPQGLTIYNLAFQLFDRDVPSLKELSDAELNALRDSLEGKPSKMVQKLNELAVALKISPLETWMQRIAETSLPFYYLKGHRPETLPFPSQWTLLRYLKTRRDSGSTNAEPTLF